MVIVSPLLPPLALTVGVVSLVMLSVDNEPVSDEAARSTAAGAFGPEVSTEIDSTPEAADAPLVGLVSVAAIDHVPSASVPKEHPVSGTTYVQETFAEPDFEAVTVMVSPTA